MAVVFYPRKNGECLVVCLSTDTKPDPTGTIWTLIESDTGNQFIVDSGDWLQVSIGYNPLTQSAVLSKVAGAGIQVDLPSPTYGWHDITADIEIRVAGSSDPTYSVYRDNIRAFEFSPTQEKEVWIVYHIPHHYVPGSDINFHTHWSNATATPNTGNVVWGFEYTSAKGHDQAAFPATTTVRVVQASSATQYFHQIAETSPVTITGLEVDSLVLVRVFRDATNVLDTCTDSVFLLEADLHMQTTNVGTKQKSPPFYT